MEIYDNLEEFLNDNTLEELEKVSEGCSNNIEEMVVYAAYLAKEIYMKEMDITDFPEDDIDFWQDLTNQLCINISLFGNVKKGDMEYTGTYTLVNNNCQFKLTQQGIDSVEKMLKPKP